MGTPRSKPWSGEGSELPEGGRPAWGGLGCASRSRWLPGQKLPSLQAPFSPPPPGRSEGSQLRTWAWRVRSASPGSAWPPPSSLQLLLERVLLILHLLQFLGAQTQLLPALSPPAAAPAQRTRGAVGSGPTLSEPCGPHARWEREAISRFRGQPAKIWQGARRSQRAWGRWGRTL